MTGLGNDICSARCTTGLGSRPCFVSSMPAAYGRAKAGSAMGRVLVAGLGHCWPVWLLTAGQRWAEGVRGSWIVQPVVVSFPSVGGHVALIGGGSAVYRFFGWTYGFHGLAFNLPGPGHGGGRLVSARFERRNLQGRFRAIRRFQDGFRPFWRFQGRFRAFRPKPLKEN